jgi:hypothetical protein
MVGLIVVAIVLLVALAVFMAGAAWKLLRQDRERSAARVAVLDELASQDPDDRVEALSTPRRMSDREHDEALEDRWDLEIRPVPVLKVSAASEFRTPPVERPQPPVTPTAAPRVPQARLFDVDEVQPSAASVAIGDGMFGATTAAPAGRTRSQIWMAAVAAIVVIGVGTGVMYVVRHADAIAGLGRQLTAGGPPSTPLELISLRHSENGGRAFSVTGFVQNPLQGGAVRDVVAVVYLFDAEGRYFASGRAPLDVKSLQPGDESPFVVTIPSVSGVSRYRVGFRTDDGDVVAHVDRRGAAPAGTTGDVINGIDRNPEPPSTPRRVEG